MVAASCVLLASQAAGQSGLSSRQPSGPYLNGRLPSQAPGAGYKATDVFPALRFKDPIQLIQRPYTPEIWVICQGGEIWAFDKLNPASKRLLLDLSATTVDHHEGNGDSGLLGIALHPEFGQAGMPRRGYIYLCYSFRPAGNGYGPYSYNRLSRFTMEDGASAINPASEMVLVNQFDRKTWHNGGDLFFGTDGFLYFSNGDEGDAIPGAEFSNSQKIDDGLFSGVMRIDVDMNPARSHPIRRQPRSSGPPPPGWPGTYTQNYFIPNDNPWQDPGGSVLEEFYAIGLRSPHRLGFDRVTGKTVFADTGHDQMEEIDVLAKGANYQWPYMEGVATGPVTTRRGPGIETPPIHTYGDRTVSGPVSIGGHVYRGQDLAGDLAGKYIFGDFGTGNVWSLAWQTAGAPRRHLVTLPAGLGYRGLSGFGQDAEGEIYMLVLGDQGRIFKLQSAGTGAAAPATLSATGVFSNLASLAPASGITPFSVNSPLWSDGASKQRWIAVPNDGAPYDASEVIRFAATGEWQFPAGAVLIKHFDLPTSETDQTRRRRLETRFLVRTQSGWYGLTYRWRADESDADLLGEGGASENVAVTLANGSTRTQRWDFPSRENCMTCHTANAGFALGVNTRQLNGSHTYPTGITANQLATWSAIGMFDTTLSSTQIAGFAKLARVSDPSASLETRMRSYLDANCSHCHRPYGVWRANFDARFDTPAAQQQIVNGPLVNTFGIEGAREVAPGDLARSMMHIRMSATNHVQMPPLARNIVDPDAIATLEAWIATLGGSTAGAFTGVDIGAQGGAGSTSYASASGTYTVRGAGPDIYNTQDGFHFAQTQLTGDGDIRARVTSLANTASWAKAGVMIREGTATGARHATMYVTPVETGNGFEFLYREATNGITRYAEGPPSNPAPNNWVCIARSGATLTGLVSANGASWTQVWSVTMANLPATLNIGLAVSSATTTTTATATFDNVQIINGAPPAAPGNLRATLNATSLSASLTWTDAASNETSYRVERSTGGAFATIATLAANATSFTDSGLSRGTTYTYRVVAVNSSGQAPSGTASITTPANRAPVWSANPVTRLAATAGQAYSSSLAGLASDPDGDSLVFSKVSGPAWLVVSSSGALSGTPGTTDAGAQSWTVRAADSGGLSASTTLQITVNVSGQFTGADIGSVGIAGSTSFASATGTYTLRGSGSDIYYGTDSFHFASRQISGDFDIRARVTSQTNTAPWAKAGVMVREGASAGARHAMMYTTPAATGNGFEFIWRPTASGSTRYASGPGNNPPPNNWVRLTRSGDVLTGYASANGTSWTFVSAVVLSGLPATVNVGLAMTSAANTVAGTVTFDNVALTPFPLPWSSSNVGTPSFNSRSESAGSSYTVVSSGTLSTAADACRYVWQTLSGDGEIRLRVISQTGGSAGVMIRDSLSSGSPFAALLVRSSDGQLQFLRRTTASTAPAAVTSAGTSPGRWLRLLRAGNLITAQKSGDGSTWTSIGAYTVTMGSSIRIGFTAVSGSASVANSAVFDNVICVP